MEGIVALIASPKPAGLFKGWRPPAKRVQGPTAAGWIPSQRQPARQLCSTSLSAGGFGAAPARLDGRAGA